MSSSKDRQIQYNYHLIYFTTLFFGVFYLCKTWTKRHYWQENDIISTSAPQSFVVSRSFFCPSPLHPFVLSESFPFRGAVSPQLLFSSPLLSFVLLHADIHTKKVKVTVQKLFCIFTSVLTQAVTPFKRAPEIHLATPKSIKGTSARAQKESLFISLISIAALVFL